MNYCSLDDAFGSPGCAGDYGGREARREERRKAKRCKGPPLAFLGLEGADGGEKDPDRQGVERMPLVPALNRQTGLREHAPVDAPYGQAEPFVNIVSSKGNTKNTNQMFQDDLQSQLAASYRDQTDRDPTGDAVRNTLVTGKQLAAEAGSASAKPAGFFGANPADGKGTSFAEAFANYMPDSKDYLLEPSFTTAFNQTLTPGARAGAADLPVPSVRDVWKPMIPNGTANTAFFEKLPPQGGRYPKADGDSHESLSRKIDRVMSRLDDIQRGNTPEQAQTDILLFISSGIFVLFMMDLAVRKGGSLRLF
jgi:hypothetical protein